MEKIRTVIIDDEVYNREFIHKMLNELDPDFEVVGHAGGVSSGISLLKKLSPQVVFLDIKMQDGTGFNLLDKVSDCSFEVVFISGFDEYALKAFDFNAVDYILKPIDEVKFKKTLSKVKQRISDKTSISEDLKSIFQSYDQNKFFLAKIPIHVNNRVVLVNIEKLIFIKASDGCTLFMTEDHEKYLSSKQISDFEFILENHDFLIRVNRGAFVNINHITSYTKGLQCSVTLSDGSTIDISRRKKGEILQLLAAQRHKVGH